MPRLATSLVVLRQQLNTAFPHRSTASDGGLASAAHRKRTGAGADASQHNPNQFGVVCAFDFTHDPEHGLDAQRLMDELDASDDPRIFYLIHNGHIDNSDDSRTVYEGDNPHPHHLHISVRYTRPDLYDDPRPWQLPMLGYAPPAPRQPRRRAMYLSRDAGNGHIYLWTEEGARHLAPAELAPIQGLLATAPGGIYQGDARAHDLLASIFARPVLQRAEV